MKSMCVSTARPLPPQYFPALPPYPLLAVQQPRGPASGGGGQAQGTCGGRALAGSVPLHRGGEAGGGAGARVGVGQYKAGTVSHKV